MLRHFPRSVAIAAITAGVIASPSLAFYGFDDFTDLINAGFNALDSLFTELIDDTFGDYSPEIHAAVQETRGVLGLPDPIEVEERLRAELESQIGGVLSPDPDNQTIDYTHGVDREATRAKAGSILSQDGQQRVVERMQQVALTTQEIGLHADNAQVAISTQAAIKEIAQQNAYQAELLGAVELELINSRVDAQLGNLTMVNISETLDQERRHRRSQQQATVQTLQTLAVMAELY